MPCMKLTQPTAQYGFLHGIGRSMVDSMVAGSTGLVVSQEMVVVQLRWSWVRRLGLLENGLKPGSAFFAGR